jgi:hypothetical protein
VYLHLVFLRQGAASARRRGADDGPGHLRREDRRRDRREDRRQD